MKANKKISVYILSGFLGSGKTTLLNNLLSGKVKEKNFVIENEFGKISIDGGLVHKNYNQLFELNNGCICCSLDTELLEVLEQLIQMEEAPDNLFIEASGVADSGVLASVFKRDDVMSYFELKKVLCVVDAENVEDRLEEALEVGRQIASSDLILLNKADTVSPSYLEALRNKIKGINPFAQLVYTRFGVMDPGLLENDTYFMAPEIFREPLTDQNGHRMKSICLQFTDAFDKDRVYSALTVTLFLHYHQVYRIKGFIQLAGLPGKYLLQSTGKKLSINKYGDWPEGEPKVSQLVFIGRGIERQGLDRIMGKSLVLEAG